MPIPPRRLGAAIEALRAVLKFEHPADGVLSHYFREHHELGQSDRAFIAEAVFGVLRHKRVLDRLTRNADARRLMLAWLARFGGAQASDLAPLLKRDEAEWLADVQSIALEDMPVPVRAELPDWTWEKLVEKLPEAEVLALGLALQQPAPLDLRVNTVKATREEVLAALKASGIDASATPFSRIGVRLAGKPAINRHPLFLDGSIEVQDEGSQLIGYLMGPRRHDLVVDFCAGAGGKSLMLGAMMNSQGRVYAFDVSPRRLARLKPRLKRSGLSNLHPHLLTSERDTKVKRLAGKIDRVLVDAPCTGFGTLRRNPDLKWRQSAADLAEMQLKQASILAAAATLVKPGGRLVYATCSLLAAENEDIIEAFLRSHPDFATLDCIELLKQHGVELAAGTELRLWPHVHNTDGFFAAALQRS